MKSQQQSNGRRGAGPLAAVLTKGLLLGLLGGALAMGCSPLRLLRPGQALLSKVTVRSEGLSSAQQERLLTLVQQMPNRSLPLPKLAIYQLGHGFYDSARVRRQAVAIQTKYAARLTAQPPPDSASRARLLARRDHLLARRRKTLEKGNAIMRLGEAPVLYDSALSRRTVSQLTTYLRAQGFFRARVAYAYADSGSVRRGPLLPAGGTDPAPSLPPPRRVAVTYTVRQGPAFTLSQLPRALPDSGVARVVAAAAPDTRLRRGEPYNEDLIGQERTRLETALKNAGYYDFRAQYITFEADTSFERGQVRLRLLVADAPGGHRAYRLRQVLLVADAGRDRAAGRVVTGRTSPRDTLHRAGTSPAAPTDASGNQTNGPGRLSTASLPAGITAAAVADTLAARRQRREVRRPAVPRDTVRFDSLRFASRGPLAFSPRVLARQVALRPGQLFSLSRTQRTQRQLSNLDMFRFNTVSYRKVDGTGEGEISESPTPDSTQRRPMGLPGVPGLLDALITSSPSPRFAETTEIGGTFVANLVGPFANLRLKWRNPFGGAEVLEISGRAGLEGQLSQLDDGTTIASTYTVQYGATAALVVPQFLLPFRLGSFLQDDQPRTRFALSTTYTRSAYFTRANTQFTLDYLWQPSAFQQYAFTPVTVGVVSTPVVSAFYQGRLDEYRRQGSPLYLSFRPIFQPSISFTSTYNSNDLNETRTARYLRWFVEVGGLTRGLYRDASWFTNRQLSVYNFAKLSVDYRRYYRLSPSTYLAWRLNGGLAHALTRSPDPDARLGQAATERYIIPYDKYLFAGGSNSVRAWAPRRLGTGTFATQLPLGGGRDYNTEQPGEVLLEGSVEYRFPVYSFIKGALFTDFGNVWTLQPDPAPAAGGPPDAQRQGVEFRVGSFARQLAVASGLGVRLDFNFLILRFDFATKVYDPTDDEPWLLRRALRQTTNQTVINVGLGYPF